MRLLFFFLFILLVSFANAQSNASVVGKVVDSRNRGINDYPITVLENGNYFTSTNLDGDFKLVLPVGKKWTILIKHQDDFIRYPVELEKGQTLVLPKTKLDVQFESGISVLGKNKDQTINDLPIIEIQNIPGPQNSVEKYLTLTTAATSNNELTNNYNVRGGSYDENLVYVNGFEIYRPFLTRTGQQEGMSFINPNLVDNISFSAGGFASRYGDKLSSVLDIGYRTPTQFRGSADLSLLGAGFHVEDALSPRFNYMVGARYQDQSYVLNSLPTQGAYRPRFYDAQFLTNYHLTENLNWSVLGHFSSNDYRFAPETQETNFGTINEALSFRVYFEGEELTKFRTVTGATSLKWDVNRRTNLDFYLSAFNSNETETFDILGQYFINELETDPSQEEFGDSVGTIGVGAFLDHARNQLIANIYQFRHEGKYDFLKISKDGLDYDQFGELRWGIAAQYEDFDDVMSEWSLVDSAGYSIPQSPASSIELFEVVKAQNRLETMRASGFLQFSNNKEWLVEKVPVSFTKTVENADGSEELIEIHDTIYNSRKRLNYHVGTRAGYTAFNDEFYFTPRAGLNYYPNRYYLSGDGKIKKRYVRLHASSGFYYQPPFYRELRELNGPMNLDVLSQKSYHFVAGVDYAFEMWDRSSPFKFMGEVYYKHMWDINPYQIDNVRTRYFADNNAVAYAYGMDMQFYGEFVEGLNSFFKLGIMRTMEDILDDQYVEYFNSDGAKIIPGFTFNDVVVDSNVVEPGFIPRPTDQWFTFATLFQDRMPGFEQFTAQLGFNFGSRLPYGPPDNNRYKDTLRQKSYFRVDIGLGYDFLYNKKKNVGIFKNFTDVRLNFEVFNLLGINNVLSQQWVQDTQGRYYAIPNYLTFRRFNLKLILRW